MSVIKLNFWSSLTLSAKRACSIVLLRFHHSIRKAILIETWFTQVLIRKCTKHCYTLWLFSRNFLETFWKFGKWPFKVPFEIKVRFAIDLQSHMKNRFTFTALKSVHRGRKKNHTHHCKNIISLAPLGIRKLPIKNPTSCEVEGFDCWKGRLNLKLKTVEWVCFCTEKNDSKWN